MNNSPPYFSQPFPVTKGVVDAQGAGTIRFPEMYAHVCCDKSPGHNICSALSSRFSKSIF